VTATSEYWFASHGDAGSIFNASPLFSIAANAERHNTSASTLPVLSADDAVAPKPTGRIVTSLSGSIAFSRNRALRYGTMPDARLTTPMFLPLRSDTTLIGLAATTRMLKLPIVEIDAIDL